MPCSSKRRVCPTLFCIPNHLQKGIRAKTPSKIQTPEPGLPNNTGPKPLAVLIVEDSPDDAELIQVQLANAGYDVSARRVDNAGAFDEALANGEWDVIVADYSIPGFGSIPALKQLQKAGKDVPFIIVSGVITDEIAVTAMRAGAHDYVLKDSVARLVPAIERELQEAIARQKRREAEQALRASEQRFRALVSASSEVLYRMSPDWSEMRFLKGGGFIADTQSPSRDWLELYIHPDDQREVWAAIQDAIEKKKLFQLEHRVRRVDGTLGWTLSRAVPLLGEDGAITEWFGAATDITVQKQAEQALIQSEKLASVGRMAATIAHEINNPLSSAVNAVYIASSDQTTSPKVREVLTIADQELRRAAHITQQTLGFYRENGSRTPVALPILIDEVLKLYARKLENRGITVDRRFNCGPCREDCNACFIVNAGEMRQIISNLLGNGIDAVRDNGRISIRVSRMTTPEGSGQNIHLTVADNGSGIRTENLKRIFEPFFTTKESVGTGLGLWIAQELVRKDNGSIRVRTRKDRGTVFRITIPATPLTSGESTKSPLQGAVTQIKTAP